MQTDGRLPDRQQFVDGGSRKADLIGTARISPYPQHWSRRQLRS
jgi:hypothetical protein